MSGDLPLIYPEVRNQKISDKHNKGEDIANCFGADAADIFEPFLRAYIPKLFNEYPTIKSYRNFISVYARRIQFLKILPAIPVPVINSSPAEQQKGNTILTNITSVFQLPLPRA
jgi:hypothetical protein